MNVRRKPSYQFGRFRLDPSEHRLLCDGRAVPLTPKAFDVLRVLVESGGRLVEKEVLLKAVWPDSFVEEAALNRNVSVLRKALGEDLSGQKYIETVPKRGYRFVASVTEYRDDQHIVGPAVAVAADRTRALAISVAAVVVVMLVAGAWFVSRRPAGEERPRSPAPTHRQVTFTGKEGAPTVSPDGRRIAYVSDGEPAKQLIVQELAGGRPVEIFSAPEINYLRWSPNGLELLVWARGAGSNGVYIVPQLGGNPRRVGGGFLACWSPDGSTVATAGALDGKIRFFNTRGQEQRTLSLQGDYWSIWDLDWSAAGDRLLLVSSNQQGRYSIETIRADGSDHRTILSSRTEIPSTRWGPQGDTIYYFQRINQTMSLFRIPAAAGTTASGTALLTGLETDRFFALSADARRLVYARAPYYSNLVLLDVATGRTHALTQGTSLVERPRVSPDGRSVVFNVGHDPLTNLYSLPMTGGVPKQLTFLNALSVGGAWSADGQRIAFASTQGGQPRIWTMAATGGSLRPISSGDLSDNLDAAWAPGSRILYQRAGNQNYYDIDPDTAAERFLVKDGSPGWMFAPVYSPDGRKIAVMWNRRPTRGIWIIDANDRSETILYPSTASSISPIGWSRDGEWLYIVEAKNGAFRGATSVVGETMTEAKIVRVAVNGGAVETVATIPSDEIGSVSMTPDGRRFVYPVFSARSDVWVVDNFDSSSLIAAR